jgi:hypothetical protein
MFKRAIVGLVLGLIGTTIFIQNDPWVREKLTSWLQAELEKAFQCSVSLSVSSCDLLFPSIELSNVSMHAHDGSWQWHADRYRTGFSWVRFLSSGAIALWAVVDSVDAETDIHNGSVAIVPHLYELMKGPDLPVPAYVSHILFKQSAVKCKQEDFCATFFWQCECTQDGNKGVAKIKCTNGDLTYRNERYVQSLKGNLFIEQVIKNEQAHYRMKIESKGDMPALGDYPTCVFTGSWQNGCGRFQLQSADHSLRLYPLILKDQKDGLYINGAASFPIELCCRLFMNEPYNNNAIKGNCTIKIQGNVSEQGSADGHIICDEITHPWLGSPIQLTARFLKNGMDIESKWELENGIDHNWLGRLKWKNTEKKASLSAHNTRAFSLPYFQQWYVPSQALSINSFYNHETREINGIVNGIIHASPDTAIPLTISTTIDNLQDISAQGAIGAYTYKLHAHNTSLTSFSLEGSSPKQSASLKRMRDGSYHGMLDYSLIQELSKELFKWETFGEGSIALRLHHDHGHYSAQVGMDKGTIRLPQTYNFINSFKGLIDVDLHKEHIALSNVSCSLHNGTISCPKGTIWFNSQTQSVPFIHLPIVIDRCLVTAKQDLFAMVSGDVLLMKHESESPHLSGHLMLNRAQLKENLFSGQLQKKLLQAAGSMQETKKAIPLSCDLTLETKDPIRVDTRFLQANAHMAIAIKGTSQDPHIEGTVSVPSGTLSFPYKPLSITQGLITFTKDLPLNPLIELTAKNTIKNHAVALHVHGSLQDHMVLLESTPPLSEEQIVSLLIAGAHEDSLDSVIPALLMQNVTSFLFSSHKLNFFDQYIKPWMKQINVTLTPKFGDQAGRGGLRGALEITVHDRWRALIEKNFSLTEDTNFELEYILSDDITFRVLRDERRDIGGEVEMKFKF